MTTFAGLPTYVARPEDSKEGSTPSTTIDLKGKKVILYGTDVFGLNINSKLMADNLAKKGDFVVLVPDILNGKALPVSLMTNFEILQGQPPQKKGFLGSVYDKGTSLVGIATAMPGFLMTNSVPKAIKTLEKYLLEIKAAGAENVAFIGFCFGGAAAVSLASNPDIVVSVSTHPGNFKLEKELNAIKAPILFNVAETDFFFNPALAKKAEAMLEKRKADNGPEYKFVEYPGTVHGFAVRGGNDDKIVEQRERCFNESLDFIKAHL